MLIAPPQLKKTPAFARAQALAKAQDLPLHIAIQTFTVREY